MFFINADAFGQVVSEFNNSGCATGADAIGNCSASIGEGSVSNGIYSVAIGGSTLTGSSAESAVAIGVGAESNGVNSFTFGERVKALDDYGMAIGRNVRSDGNYAYIFGHGAGTPFFINDQVNTMMFGMNSNVPTLFIDASTGGGTWGNVGIGNITSPASLLHVRDQVRVGLTSGANGSLVFNNSAGSTITLNTPTSMSTQNYTLPTAVGTVNQVLALTGVSGSVGTLGWVSGGGSTTAWELAGNSDATSSSILGATVSGVPLMIYAGNAERIRVASNGNVGIGTATPDGILHLLALSSTDTDLIIEKADAREGALIFDNNGTQSASIAYNSGEQMIFENTIANNEIRFRVSNGTVTEVMTVDGADLSVGIGVSNPESKLHVDADDASSATETVALFTVGENTIERFVLRNNSTTNGAFAPMMGSVSRQTNDPAMLIQAEVDNGNDTGTEPAMTFQVRNDATTFTTRPLFRWEEPNTVRMQMNAGGNLGIGTTSPSGRLHVAGGNIRATGIPAGAGTEDVLGIEADGDFVNITQSSIHFKQDVQGLSFDKEAFFSMDAVRFNWKEIYGGSPDVGFIAQQVEETFPEMGIYRYKLSYLDNGDFLRDSIGDPLVDSTQMEVRGVRYHKLPVYLYELAKQQETLNTELQQRLTELEGRLNDCCAVQPSLRIGTEEEPRALELKSFLLDQNDPNPFSDYTSINVTVPESVRSAQIMITGMNGRIVKVIDLEVGQTDRLTIYSSEIGKGFFSYSLLLDGKVVETKKMTSIR